MATNTTAQTASAPKADDFDRSDLNRTFARLKHEVGGLVDDAKRARPFYAKSKEEAIAKRNAAVKVLDEFAHRIVLLKKEDA